MRYFMFSATYEIGFLSSANCKFSNFSLKNDLYPSNSSLKEIVEQVEPFANRITILSITEMTKEEYDIFGTINGREDIGKDKSVSQ